MRRLLIAAAIVMLLIVAGVVTYMSRRYAGYQQHAQQLAMRVAVQSIRHDLAQYKSATGHYPRSLDELRHVPVDPVTHSAKTWQVETEESVQASGDFMATSAPPKNETVIVDVRSGAPGNDSDGKPWSSY
jgi:general secretion pathway protein G